MNHAQWSMTSSKAYVHLLYRDFKSSQDAFLSVWSPFDVAPLRGKNRAVTKMKLVECYKQYDCQVDTSPIGGQMLVYSREKHQTNIRLDDLSDCVLPYHDKFEACKTCLTSKDITPRNFSATDLLQNTVTKNSVKIYKL